MAEEKSEKKNQRGREEKTNILINRLVAIAQKTISIVTTLSRDYPTKKITLLMP